MFKQKSALAAEMRQKDIQLQQLIGDYLTDYADAKDKYRSTLAKVQVGMSEIFSNIDI